MPAQAWVTLFVGVGAAIGVTATLAQRNRADNRREWWARFEWALDATYSDDARRRRDGWRILEIVVTSPLTTSSEAGLLAALGENGPQAHGQHAESDVSSTSGGG